MDVRLPASILPLSQWFPDVALAILCHYYSQEKRMHLSICLSSQAHLPSGPPSGWGSQSVRGGDSGWPQSCAEADMLEDSAAF